MLAGVARAAAEAGDLDRAGTLAGQAEAAARAIPDPDRQAEALAGVSCPAFSGQGILRLFTRLPGFPATRP